MVGRHHLGSVIDGTEVASRRRWKVFEPAREALARGRAPARSRTRTPAALQGRAGGLQPWSGHPEAGHQDTQQGAKRQDTQVNARTPKLPASSRSRNRTPNEERRIQLWPGHPEAGHEDTQQGHRGQNARTPKLPASSGSKNRTPNEESSYGLDTPGAGHEDTQPGHRGQNARTPKLPASSGSKNRTPNEARSHEDEERGHPTRDPGTKGGQQMNR